MKPPNGLVVACDVPSLKTLETLILHLSTVTEVTAFKVGAAVALRYGVSAVVEVIRSLNDGAFILYDHQKAGSDIPDTARELVATCALAGVDAVIVFPHSGPHSLQAFIRAIQESGLIAIVGGLMTHSAFLKSDGGYIDDAAPLDIYKRAADLGVTEFVVPATRPKEVAEYVQLLNSRNIEAGFWSPGFGAQRGDATQIRTILSDYRFYPIIGRAIYGAENPAAAAREIASTLLAH